MTDPWGDLATYRQKKRQKFKVYLTKGVSVNPKAYCCDDNTINDQKPPVAILTATPNPIYEGDDLTLDMTGSYDPDGGGIADPGGYEITDGIGGTYAATKTQVVNYPNAGRFEARGVVTDADGLMGEASTWVEVLSADGVNPPEPPGDWRKSIYLATKVDGIFFTEDFTGPGGADPEWELVNTGLGTTNTRAIVGDPWNPSGRQYTRTTEPKLYRRTGGDWGVILDQAIAEAVTLDANILSFDCGSPVGNINAEGHVYVLVNLQREPPAPDWKQRLYLFKSENYGGTGIAADWTAHLIHDWSLVARHRQLVVGAFKGSSAYPAGYVIYAMYTRNALGDWGMKVSVNQGVDYGAQISLRHCRPSAPSGGLTVQGADQDIIYWVGRGTFIGGTEFRLQKSINRGDDFTNLWVCAATPGWTQRPNIYHWGPLSAFIATGATGLRWTEDDWANHVLYTNADNFDVDGCSRVMDAPELLYGWQADDPGGGDMQHVIAVSANRGGNWEGKAGDDPVTPSATSIPNDCGGVAGILQVWTED